MTTLSTVVLVAYLATAAIAAVPPNYILKVSPTCGRNVQDNATIEIITDLYIEARVECANHIVVNFTQSSDVVWSVPVVYPENTAPAFPCCFTLKPNVQTYDLDVHVAYGEKGGVVHMQEERFLVTCTLAPHGTEHSPEHFISDSLIAPPELLFTAGGASNSSAILKLVDVCGEDLTGQSIHLGKKVQLKGVLNALNGEVGLKPVKCTAMDGNSTYDILRAGCGDGLVFNKSEGFTVNGTTCRSPFFDIFSLDFSTAVQFRCIFVTCVNNCDGNSCSNVPDVHRKRREVSGFLQANAEQVSNSVRVRSDIVRFYGVEKEPLMIDGE